MTKTKQKTKTEKTNDLDLSYIEGVGRRKTATARVRIYPSTSKPFKIENIDMIVNDKDINSYFKSEKLVKTAIAPLKALDLTLKTTIKTTGGGINAQADAIRLGLARALNAQDEKWRPRLRALKLLTRDARAVERKKPGLRKARRPQQWRKR